MPARPWKPTKGQLAAARDKTIRDVIARSVKVLFVGINPSLYSAAVGHHFARPGNRFWPALDRAGLTDRLLSPFEDRKLLEFGCGITNLAARATARADELTPDELAAGARRLKRKVRRYGIGCVAFLGVTAYRTAFDRKETEIGRQPDTLAGAEVWVLPNPSGLNAHYQVEDFARLFRRVGRGEMRR